MDSEFWTARLAAAKRQLQQQQQNRSSQMDRFNMDEFEVEEEVRPDFTCPYCYEDFDLGSLCVHLDDEHSFEPKGAVCPICSVKVARDMLSHITLQHGHLFKLQRRRRLRRIAIPSTQALSVLGRDLREAHLQVLLGSNGSRSSNMSSSSNAVTDPLLSSLIMNFPSSEPEDISKSVLSIAEESSSKREAPQHIWKASFDPSLSHEEREKRMRQAAGKAVFLQDLVVSTLLVDLN